MSCREERTGSGCHAPHRWTGVSPSSVNSAYSSRMRSRCVVSADPALRACVVRHNCAHRNRRPPRAGGDAPQGAEQDAGLLLITSVDHDRHTLAVAGPQTESCLSTVEQAAAGRQTHVRPRGRGSAWHRGGRCMLACGRRCPRLKAGVSCRQARGKRAHLGDVQSAAIRRRHKRRRLGPRLDDAAPECGHRGRRASGEARVV